MWILVAEALGALGLLIFIVWWTLGPTQRREREALDRAARDDAARRATTTGAAVDRDAASTRSSNDPPSTR